MNSRPKVNNLNKFDIEQIKSIPILEVAQELDIEVKNNLARCVNPSHNDSNPSMSFKPSQNFFKCFGCEIQGSNIDLVMCALEMDKGRAIKWIGDTFNLQRQGENTPPYTIKSKSKRLTKPYTKPQTAHQETKRDITAYTEIWNCFINWIAQDDNLQGSKILKLTNPYLTERGIEQETTTRILPKDETKQKSIVKKLIDKFGFEKVKESGLIKNDKQLVFKYHRLIIPYLNYDTEPPRIESIQARKIDEFPNLKGKYKLLKGFETVPYMLESLPKSGDVYFCEGAIDVLSAYELGLKPTIGIVGNHIKDSLIEQLKGLNVILIQDRDQAGESLLESLCEKLSNIETSDVEIFDLNYLKNELGIDEPVKDINDILRIKQGKGNNE